MNSFASFSKGIHSVWKLFLKLGPLDRPYSNVHTHKLLSPRGLKGCLPGYEVHECSLAIFDIFLGHFLWVHIFANLVALNAGLQGEACRLNHNSDDTVLKYLIACFILYAAFLKITNTFSKSIYITNTCCPRTNSLLKSHRFFNNWKVISFSNTVELLPPPKSLKQNVVSNDVHMFNHVFCLSPPTKNVIVSLNIRENTGACTDKYKHN